ncbi:serine/arginine repetitive matrix protein 2 [Rudaeicoccus suwonensis]|uniref:Uncharacterized protein n=1 Tax=Rudaeicoccus suwonensis TaxID=657409 RepID=A0A561EBU0_9MICO|nr:serine/arginine repetitive matrix protein 2 [Rudaeicoccus suwonensis]TWE13074.1 hypothetical protein BKA23_1902 [Rudaeicoccus suwonensis]
MVAMPIHPPSHPASSELAFASPAGLRALLDRLSQAGEGAWQTDPEATALLAYTIQKYEPLARSWHRDPGEAATAAFLAMRHNGVRHAADPWAVITRAVQVSFSAESHAERHLTSTEKARRSQHAERDIPLRTGELTDNLTVEAATLGSGTDPGPEPVLADAAMFLRLLGWPESLAGTAVEYIAARLADAGSIQAGYETLRRDVAMRAQLDLDRAAWAGLLGVLLGSRPQPGRPTRKGVFARLLLGESVRDLLDDNRLVRATLTARPSNRVSPAGGGWGE